MLEAVLWDIDGTLIDSEPAHDRAVMLALQELQPAGFKNRSAHDLDMLGTTWDATWKNVGGLPEMLDAFEQKVASIYLDNIGSLLPRDNAVEIVRRLDKMGVSQAGVSNSRKVVVDANIKHLGLDDILKVRICREDVTLSKPEPEPFLRAAQRLGVSPSLCLVVEDSPRGILSAKRAGAVAVFWPQGEVNVNAQSDYQIKSLNEVDWKNFFCQECRPNHQRIAGIDL